ncbi:MAG: DUF4349 domain-containing protein [Arachnia sp.]
MLPHRRLGSLPLVILALIAPLALAACGAEAPSGGAPARAPAQGEVAPQAGGLPEEGDTTDGERMVIRTKVLRLQVDSTPDAIDKVREATRSRSGTVEAMQVATDNDEWIYRQEKDGSGDGTALRGWITVRVPTDAYEQFVADVAAIGTVLFQSESTEDVTQQHVDLSARLANLRAQEARLREFFDAAKDVDDMLSVEKELGRIRGEIESMDAQVTYLERQAAMATVTVEIAQPRPVVSPGGNNWGFVDAVTSGIRGAAALLTGVLTAVIASSPLWIAALILFFPLRAFIRRRRAASAKRPPWPVHEPPPADKPSDN